MATSAIPPEAHKRHWKNVGERIGRLKAAAEVDLAGLFKGVTVSSKNREHIIKAVADYTDASKFMANQRSMKKFEVVVKTLQDAGVSNDKLVSLKDIRPEDLAENSPKRKALVDKLNTIKDHISEVTLEVKTPPKPSASKKAKNEPKKPAVRTISFELIADKYKRLNEVAKLAVDQLIPKDLSLTGGVKIITAIEDYTDPSNFLAHQKSLSKFLAVAEALKEAGLKEESVEYKAFKEIRVTDLAENSGQRQAVVKMLRNLQGHIEEQMQEKRENIIEEYYALRREYDLPPLMSTTPEKQVREAARKLAEHGSKIVREEGKRLLSVSEKDISEIAKRKPIGSPLKKQTWAEALKHPFKTSSPDEFFVHTEQRILEKADEPLKNALDYYQKLREAINKVKPNALGEASSVKDIPGKLTEVEDVVAAIGALADKKFVQDIMRALSEEAQKSLIRAGLGEESLNAILKASANKIIILEQENPKLVKAIMKKSEDKISFFEKCADLAEAMARRKEIEPFTEKELEGIFNKFRSKIGLPDTVKIDGKDSKEFAKEINEAKGIFNEKLGSFIETVETKIQGILKKYVSDELRKIVLESYNRLYTSVNKMGLPKVFWGREKIILDIKHPGDIEKQFTEERIRAINEAFKQITHIEMEELIELTKAVRILNGFFKKINSKNSLDETLKILNAIFQLSVNLPLEDFFSKVIEYIKDGCNVNFKNDKGYSVLMRLAFAGKANIVEQLLAFKGIDVNAKDEAKLNNVNYAHTALILAIANSQVKTVEALLSHPDIRVNEQNALGSTALMWAVEKNNIDIVKLLLGNKFIDVNKKDNSGETALMHAARENKIISMKEIIDAKSVNPPLDLNVKDKDGFTALIVAAARGNTNAVKLLLDQPGIDINAQDKSGFTALMRAAKDGKEDVVRLLLDKKARTDIKLPFMTKTSIFKSGDTAEDMASTKPIKDLIKKAAP